MTIERFLAIVNKVTAYHRHGNTIPKSALDNLCNAQLEIEANLQNKSSNSDDTECSCGGRMVGSMPCEECSNGFDVR